MSGFVTHVIRAKTELTYVSCNLTLDVDVAIKVGLVQRIKASLHEKVSVCRQVHNAIGWEPYDAVFESVESLVGAMDWSWTEAVRRDVDWTEHPALQDFLQEAGLES